MKLRWLAGLLVLAAVAPLSVAQADEPSPARGGGWPFTRCEFIPTPDKPAARPVRPPRPWAFNRGTVEAEIKTNFGEIEVELNRENAPCAVHNLVHLARSRFYDHSQCWRLTNSARLGVLQCGDIISVEVGGPGYRFADELTGQETYPRGTIAMGNQGPDTNGSQWFIVHSHANIAPAYTVLGRVTEGMEALDAIVAGGIIPGPDGNPLDGAPAQPVKIRRIRAEGW